MDERDADTTRIADDAATRAAVAEGQSIQKRIDVAARPASQDRGPVQAGQRTYPARFAAEHQAKPGREADLDPPPMFEAPAYRGSGKLEGMAAIVTGGDSGIGRAVAVLFAREGADVAIVYLDEHEDAERTRRAVEAEGRRCVLMSGDVGSSAFCRRVAEETLSAFGRLDVLVNNAAFQQHAPSITDISDEQLDRTVRTNLCGYFYMARAAVAHMTRGGSILMTGSVTGIAGSPQLLDYAMTKGGIHAFARSLAGQLLPRGIRVNAIAPGPVWTPLNPADKPAETVASFGADTPMGRAAQPEEIAPAFVFLAAPTCSSYITGEVLPIIGGYEG